MPVSLHLPACIRIAARRPPSDRVILIGCAALALAMAAVTDQGAHRVWGVVAGAGYLSLGLSRLALRPCAPWLAGLTGAAIPLAVLLIARSSAGPGGVLDTFAQPEVRLVETAAQRWMQTGTPYPGTQESAALAAAGHGIDGYFPYLPGMAVLGLPRTLMGPVWWTDARVVFVLVTAVCVWFALRRRLPGRVAGWAAVGNPVVGLTAATGGHDLPMAGLLLAAFACCAPRPGTVPRRLVAAPGLLAGLALTTKPTAWPVVVVLLVLIATVAGHQSAIRAVILALTPVLACLPAVLTAGPRVVTEQLLAFPAGLAAVASPAGSPLPGGWLAALPHGRSAALLLLGVAALLVARQLWRQPPGDAEGAALFAAAATTVAVLLAPSSRVGWLVLPLLLVCLPGTSRHGHSGDRPARARSSPSLFSTAGPSAPETRARRHGLGGAVLSDERYSRRTRSSVR